MSGCRATNKCSGVATVSCVHSVMPYLRLAVKRPSGIRLYSHYTLRFAQILGRNSLAECSSRSLGFTGNLRGQ